MLKNESSNSKVSINLKKAIDNAVVEAVLIDGRAHGDLKKKGISRVFALMCPGYTAQCRQTINKKIKNK